MDDTTEHPQPGVIEGNVLVAGCGFIVTAGAWALFGFLEGDLAFTSSSGLFFALAVAHGVTGALVLLHRAFAVALGIAVAGTGLVVAGLDTQFVLVFTNVVILSLLLMARGNIRGHSS